VGELVEKAMRGGVIASRRQIRAANAQQRRQGVLDHLAGQKATHGGQIRQSTG